MVDLDRGLPGPQTHHPFLHFLLCSLMREMFLMSKLWTRDPAGSRDDSEKLDRQAATLRSLGWERKQGRYEGQPKELVVGGGGSR